MFPFALPMGLELAPLAGTRSSLLEHRSRYRSIISFDLDTWSSGCTLSSKSTLTVYRVGEPSPTGHHSSASTSQTTFSLALALLTTVPSSLERVISHSSAPPSTWTSTPSLHFNPSSTWALVWTSFNLLSYTFTVISRSGPMVNNYHQHLLKMGLTYFRSPIPPETILGFPDSHPQLCAEIDRSTLEWTVFI